MSQSKKCARCGKRPAVKYRDLCHTCRNKKDKERYPFRYHWWKLRGSARRRGIPFDMSLEEFKKLWLDSGKWEQKKVQTRKSRPIWSVDRIDVNEGYTFENCQIVPKNLNVRLWHTRDKWNIRFRWRERYARNNNTTIEEAPF